jgi:hypothetical protein
LANTITPPFRERLAEHNAIRRNLAPQQGSGDQPLERLAPLLNRTLAQIVAVATQKVEGPRAPR